MTPCIIVVGLSLLVCIGIFRCFCKHPTSIEKPDSNPNECDSDHLPTVFGTRDGEYVKCPHCGHTMRVGNGRICPNFSCEECNKQVMLRVEHEEDYQKEVQQEREQIYNSMKGRN